MSKKCKAYSVSKLGLDPADNRKAFYAGWDAALAEQPAQQCVCGEPETSGTHRIDGPCYAEQPAQPSKHAAGWDSIEAMAAERYKVVPSHDSMFYRRAVVAGNGTQQLYIGPEVECENMARKFAGAFLDGAFVMQSRTSPPAQRTWVGLTEKEMNDITCGMVKSWVMDQLARTIEAKLKEKNA